MAENPRLQAEWLRPQLEGLIERWRRGESHLKELVGLSDEEMYAIATQGYYFFLQGRAREAKVIFEGLLAIDPTSGYYHRALGAVLWRLRDSDAALRAFSQAIRVQPSDLLGFMNRAEVLVSLRRFAEAAQDLRHVLGHTGRAPAGLINKAHAMLTMIR